MDERQAAAMAQFVGGDAWNSGGGIWLVRIQKGTEKLVVISDEAVCEYADEDAFESGEASSTILLV